MLRLLIGRAGSGKTSRCFEEIKSELSGDKDGPALIYLVPEQAAFQSEYALSTLTGPGASMRAQSLSFRRLAWKVLQETGGGRRIFIDDTGKGMVLRKALEKHKKSLKIFHRAGETPGLIDALVQLYNELHRARIDIFQLRELQGRQAQEQGKTGLLHEKLHDLALIIEEAEHELSKHYLDSEDILLLLSLKLSQSFLGRGVSMWVDGFYGFTRLELLVLESLLGQLKMMTVSLCLAREHLSREKVDEFDPFLTTAQTYHQLKNIALKCKVGIEYIILPPEDEETPVRFRNCPPLAHLERNLHTYPALPYTRADEMQSLRLTVAANRRVEVEEAAREIIALARDRQYRFREMAVVAHNIEEYGDLVESVFNSYDIPFFLDQKRTILHHPLVEFIRSALEVVNGNWRTDAVMRCIKSSFLFPVEAEEQQRRYWRDQGSKLENYVLAFGIKGDAWQRENAWQYNYRNNFDEDEAENRILSAAEQQFLEEINRTRRFLSAPLLHFQEEYKASSLVRDRVMALYNFLQSISAEKHLQLTADQALAEGDPEKSREQAQVYQGIISMLEQLVEINGEEKISPAFFARLIEAGISAIRLGLAPPSLDQVLVGNLERTRTGNLRALFLLGVNEGVLPARPAREAIFTEAEKEALESQGFNLSPGPRRRLLDDEFLIYITLTRPNEQLRVSYPLADAEGRALLPSMLINRLQDLFPALTRQQQRAEGRDADPQGEIFAAANENAILSFICHPRQTLSSLVVQLESAKRGEPLHPLWQEVYNWYACGGENKEVVQGLLGGLFYQNRELNLTPWTSGKLYGQTLHAGTTRLERFCSCPFAHFAAHGLRLQQRRLHGLDASDTGRFFHAALRNISCTLQKEQKYPGELDEDNLIRIVSEEVAKLLPRLQQEIILSSSRYQHLAKKMEETVGRTLIQLAEHDRRSEFKPYAVEQVFGESEAWPPLLLPLANGSTVNVVGRIDRIDHAVTEENHLYVRLIDYKSGSARLNLTEIYHGISLQLILYLEVALSHAREQLGKAALPAGVFYFRVHDPLISSNGPMLQHQLQAEMLKRFKLTGMILAEPAVVKLMDNQMQSGYSQVVPAAINKQGKLYSSARSLLTENEFAALCQHARKIVTETAMQILDGCIEISPFSIGPKKACTYCLYKTVCQFDRLLEENDYRRLTNVSVIL